MDLKQLISSAPLLWRLWKWAPGPLKVIVLVLALAVWLFRRAKGDPVPETPEREDRGEIPGPGSVPSGSS